MQHINYGVPLYVADYSRGGWYGPRAKVGVQNYPNVKIFSLIKVYSNKKYKFAYDSYITILVYTNIHVFHNFNLLMLISLAISL